MSEHVSGPWFDGRAAHAIADYERWAEQTVAERGARLVQQNLHGVLKHPTGYYESHIQAHPDGERWMVDDGGIVYGPWLEGTGSRNAPKTRFRGYATFRRTVQQLDVEASGLVDPIPARYLEAMNV